MFKKLKMKASEPLTHGWLWKIGTIDIIAVGIIYGVSWAYGYHMEKQFNEADAATKEDTESKKD